MATAKAERLLNLVIALVNSPQYRSAAWIRDKVAGYSDAPNDEAFFRTFERDKQELRELGIPVQTPPAGSDGYRIPPVDFALPAVSLTPAEAAALALAGRLWETTALASAGSGALRKIRDAAGGNEQLRRPPAAADTAGVGTNEVAAATLLQPRVRTGDPAFAPLYAAVRARRAVQFEYRKDPGTPAEPRRVQPWGLVSFRGRWYVIGYDEKRAEPRTFRLSRIAGPVKPVGRAGVVRTPAGLDLLQRGRGQRRAARRPNGHRPDPVRPGRRAAPHRDQRARHRRPGLGPGDPAARASVGHGPPDRRPGTRCGGGGAGRPGRRHGAIAQRDPAGDAGVTDGRSAGSPAGTGDRSNRTTAGHLRLSDTA